MADDAITVANDPRYKALVRTRGRFTWALTAVVGAAFFGFILLVAFNKPLLARPIGDGVTSLGIVIGFGLILLAIVATAIYVVTANRHFDPLVDALQADHQP